MKPADHPEFFLRAAPFGRSRESTIALDRDGRLTHDGEPVEHARLARALLSWVKRHPDNGRFILENGYDWCYFRVEDTGYFVEGVREDAGTLQITLSDGSCEALAPETLSVDDDGVLRVVVKDGREAARFSRRGQLAVVPFLDDGEPPALRVAERRYPIAGA